MKITPNQLELVSNANNNLNNLNTNGLKYILDSKLKTESYQIKSIIPQNKIITFILSNYDRFFYILFFLILIHLLAVFIFINLIPLITTIYLCFSSIILIYFFAYIADRNLMYKIFYTWDFFFLSVQIILFKILICVYNIDISNADIYLKTFSIIYHVLSIFVLLCSILISDVIELKKLYKIIIWLLLLGYCIYTRYSTLNHNQYPNQVICILYKDCAEVRTIIANIINYIIIIAFRNLYYVIYKSNYLIFYKSNIIKKIYMGSNN